MDDLAILSRQISELYKQLEKLEAENRRLKAVAKAAEAYVEAEDRMARENVLETPNYVIDAWRNLVGTLAALEEAKNK
jgi:hypothetical protein